MKHIDKHPTYVDECFGCKLQTLQWGIVPGASRATSSGTYYDKESILDSGIPTKEEVMDRRSRFLNRAAEAYQDAQA